MLTGTVSLLSACSALNSVVWMRWSIQVATRSRIGTIQNTPGPLTACSRPMRSTTARSHWLAIISDCGIRKARIASSAASVMLSGSPAPSARLAPARARQITERKVARRLPTPER